MADEPQVIRAIDWKAVFPFTLLFRSFRIAIHPSKLVLGLCALLLVWLGGTLIDGMWPSRYSAIPGELMAFEESTHSPTDGSEEFYRVYSRAREEMD